MHDHLKKMREQKAFKAPQGYFESLEDRLIEKIPFKESKRQKESWIDHLVYRLHLRFSVPAFSVLILVACVIYISLEAEIDQPILMNDEEIAAYLLEVYDEDLELALFATAERNSEPTKITLVSDEEIMNYLYEEVSEEELIEYIPNQE
jgi:hypothetical protein